MTELLVYVFVACVIEEEGDDDVAGDREGSACVYDCGWSPVKRERVSIFPEPVMEGFSWGAEVNIELNMNVCANRFL